MTAFPDVAATLLANLVHQSLKDVNVCGTSMYLVLVEWAHFSATRYRSSYFPLNLYTFYTVYTGPKIFQHLELEEHSGHCLV